LSRASIFVLTRIDGRAYWHRGTMARTLNPSPLRKQKRCPLPARWPYKGEWKPWLLTNLSLCHLLHLL